MKYNQIFPRYVTTLSQDEEAVIAEAHGRNADPTQYLISDKSVEGLIEANKPTENREAGWRSFFKAVRV
jgi:hypothetical protein